MKWEATVRFHHMTDLRAASRNTITFIANFDKISYMYAYGWLLGLDSRATILI